MPQPQTAMEMTNYAQNVVSQIPTSTTDVTIQNYWRSILPNPNDNAEQRTKKSYKISDRLQRGVPNLMMVPLQNPPNSVSRFRELDEQGVREWQPWRESAYTPYGSKKGLLTAKEQLRGGMGSAYAPTPASNRRYITSETGVVFRSAPGGARIDYLRRGYPVRFTGERRYYGGRYWDEVEFRGTTGWAATDFVGIYHPTTTLMRNAGVHFAPSYQVDAFIRNYEQLFLTSYDAVPGTGDWTIGWGHKLHNYSGQRNNPSITWTLEQAEQAFVDDMQTQAYTSFIPFLIENNISLMQQQFDAMLSWTFNFGEFIWDENEVGTDGEAMRNFLLAGDFSEQATRAAFAYYMGSRAYAGHILRRLDEIDMFLFGYYERR